MAYVYRHIREDKNTPFYIGVGTDLTYKRSKDKLPSQRNKIWLDIIKKTNYFIEILIDNVSFEEALLKEKEFIFLYGRISNNTGTLSNLTEGGEGTLGFKQTKESRIKMSIAKKQMTQETKDKISASCKNPSKETRKKISEAGKGRICSEATKIKRALKHKGRKNTELTKLKMSESAKNRSKEYNANLSINHFNNKKIVHIPTGNIFRSIAETARVFNLNRRALNYLLLENKTNEFKYVE